MTAALGRHDGGDLVVAQPAEQAAQLGAQNSEILETAEQGLDGVEHHAPGADLPDGMFEAHEQAFEIVFAGFLDFAAIDVHVVDQQLALLDQLFEVVAQRLDVLGQLRGIFLEGEQHTGLAVGLRAIHEKTDP
jgi:hypothetical protein